MPSRYLLVNLSHLHLRSVREIEGDYVSVLWEGRFYFSNTYNSQQAQQHSILLNHNLVLPLEDTSSLSLLLQTWENHMIVFQHEVDLNELRTRTATRKKVEMRQGEILDFTVHLLQENQFHLSSTFRTDVAQHFLLIHSLTLHDEDKTLDHGPSYVLATHDAGEIAVPVVNAVAMFSLPSMVKFTHFKNGKLRGTSKQYSCEELAEGQPVRMVAGEDIGYDLQIGLFWGINLWRHRPERTMLLDAQEVLLYEIEVRMQGGKDMAGAKLKINCGTRSFELNGDGDNTSSMRFARIVYFVMKSEEDDFEVVLERKERALAKAIIGSEQLLSHHLNILKRKLMDNSGRPIASIRFKCQKAKNLSLPQNNAFWKAQSSKGKQSAVILQFSQLSVQWERNDPCGLIIKSQEEELFVPQLTNLNFFQLQTEIPEPAVLTLRQEGNVYLKLVESATKADFLGIAVLNYKELRLGVNVLSLSFFKQQTASCLLHLVVNKVVTWPFVRGVGIPDSLSTGLRLLGISIQVHRLQLTPYYYSYRYDRKGELYCIVEVNRIKKVLILQPLPTRTNALLFVNASGSDLLNFTADQLDSARLRLTLLVGDGGVEEDVYGVLQRKVNVDSLRGGPVRFDGLQLANDHGIAVGEVDLQVQLGMAGQLKKPIKRDLKNVQNSLAKVNKSIERVQKSISKRENELAVHPKKRYQSLKLPEIKDPKQQRLKRLAKMLELKQSIDAKRKKKRRVQSERRANIEEHPFANNNSRLHQVYTNIELDPPEIGDMRESHTIHNYEHDIQPQEKKEELHIFDKEEDLPQPNQIKYNDFVMDDLQQNEFANNTLEERPQ